jgi:penicillin-binding protein 2
VSQLKKYQSILKVRFYVLYGLYGLLFCILLIGLGYRQLILGSSYQKKQELQSLRRIVQPGTRGTIYDRNGKVLAGSKPRYSAVLYLSELRRDLLKAYRKHAQLAKLKGLKISRKVLEQEARYAVVSQYAEEVKALLGCDFVLDPKQVETHFQQRLLLPFVLIQELTLEQYARLSEKVPVSSPLQVLVDSVRYYPNGSSASHVIGYVTTSMEAPDIDIPGESLATFSFKSQQGKAGLEKQFDDYLQGGSGGFIWVVDPAGFQYDLVYNQPAFEGKHLFCSLDIELQKIAERALDDMKGSVVVIHVPTSEVLVLASKPDYDLNQLATHLPQSVYEEMNRKGAWLNRAIQGLYPPGSPFKLIATAAFFRQGIIKTNTIIDCPGFLNVGDRKFRCLARFGHGEVGIVEALSKSCNVFFYESALKLGGDGLVAEARLFGLHEPTGIELPYETRNMLVPSSDWKQRKGLGKWMSGDTTNMCIGQGYLLVTPLQMAAFGAALAANQMRIHPTIIHEPKSLIQPTTCKPEPTGLTNEQYQLIIQGMIQATQSGTAKRIHIPGVAVAAKTGTSQVKYQGKDLDIAWFLGFAPADNPQIVVVVALESQEVDSYYGGKTAAPVANTIMQAYFNL